ncbi:hypothetical protein K474DRAFT_1670074 [Panus rudis PR-1116 ss-1]|nr:hypothetical protein K474DRAFT_1670074 [Panus rudis PR-1116 ss-1]
MVVADNELTRTVWARCARGDHNWETKYGACGIITAVLLFPIGLICLLYVPRPSAYVVALNFFAMHSMDTERKCTRCGTVVG